MKKALQFFIKRNIFGNMLTFAVLIGGILAISTMKREAFPKVDFDIVIITTVYPGASPQEVEKLITIPIERELKSVDGIKRTDSSCLESRGATVLTLEPDVSDKEKVIQDIKDSVDRAKLDFPDNVEEPLVQELSSSRTPIIEVALNSKAGAKNSFSEFELRKLAKRLAEKIEGIADVAQVSKKGYRDREIHIEVDPQKMAIYNMSVDEIIDAVVKRNINFPGGSVISGRKEYTIRTVKEFKSAAQIRDTLVRANDLGGAINIGDIAQVKDGFEKEKIIEKANGKKAIILTILKRENGDAITLVDKVLKILDEFKKDAPEYLELTTFNDLSYYIRRRLNVLTNNVGLGMVFVLGCLLFFLGWRISLMVGIGVPFAFAITFLIMKNLDISINLISMFGLIIVSGMVVDDAIIVGENVYRHLEKGTKPIKAALMGVQEMVMPLVGAISTTVMAFLPLMMMSGIMGKFIWYIPAAVIIALVASLLECFFILPAHLAEVTKNAKRSDLVKGDNSLEHKVFQFLQNIYMPSLKFALKHKYLVLMLTFFMFIFGFALIPLTGFVLFPKEGVEIFFAKVEAEQGTSLEEMNRRIAPLEEVVSQLPKNELDSFVARVGIHQEQPNDPFTRRGNNYAQLAIYLTPESKRSRRAGEIVGYLKNKFNPEHPLYNVTTSGKNHSVDLVSNFNYVSIRDSRNLAIEKKRWKISNEFLLGGGKFSQEKYAYYTGDNKLLIYKRFQEKSEVVYNISLKSYDSPRAFYVLKNKDIGVLITELGYLIAINLNDGTSENLQHYSSQITSLWLSETKLEFYISSDNGSLSIWSYKDSIELEKEYFEGATLKINLKEKSKNRSGIFLTTQNTLPRIETVVASSDGEHLYLSCFDGSVRVFSLKQRKFISNYFINERSVFWAEADISNNKLLWFSQRDVLGLYDVEKKKIIFQKKIVGQIYRSARTTNRNYLLGSHNSVYRIYYPSLKGVVTLKAGQRDLQKVEFKQAGGGPPVGAPVQIEVRGDDYDDLQKVASIVKEKLFAIEGVYDIRDNWESGKEEFHVEIKDAVAARAGVSVMQIATTIQAAFEGNVSTSIKKSDEEIDIRVLFPEKLRETLSSLNQVKVRNSIGNLVPITVLAEFKKYPGVSVITHSNHRRTIYVKANLDARKTSSVKVNQQILNDMKFVKKDYSGIDIYAGGEYEDTQESMRDLMQAGFIAIMGIGLILVLMFRNLRHPRVIMAAIPLGLVGVSIAFFIHKHFFQPNLVFSFLASMGIVGLAGVVVNDSIVLVDFINNLRRAGMNKYDAIINGCHSRLRAIILTTVTTSAGLLPTAYGLGGNDPFLRPMALAMAWGLIFATVITLIVIPVFYSIWEDRGFIFHHAVVSDLKRLELKEE